MMSYLSENEAKNLQNGIIHLGQIRPDFEMGYLEYHLAILRTVMTCFLHLSSSFILA